MNLTLGFIAFFISIVIPGIIFRRFFFYGEFSKQFNTKDPVLHSVFFSIIPGIVIQIITFISYNLSIGFDASYLDVFTIFRDITSDGTNGTQKATKNFINNELVGFFWYSIGVFVFASFSGWFCSRLIRTLKWDKKYKLFRYNNQWYYIFSGEVLNMKKFEDAHHVSFKSNKGQEQDTLMTYADILVSVSEQNDRKELYTGYVVDYDLKSDDITQLDKIYLIDTHRYKKKEKNIYKKGVESKEVEPKQSRNRLKVPGDIFVLNAKNIVNLNLTYIPSVKKKIEKEKKEAKKQRVFSKIQIGYLIFIVLVILIHFFYKFLNLDQTILSDYFISISFWGKLLVIFFINQLIVLFVPSEGKDKKLRYDFKNIGIRASGLIIWGALLFWFVIKPLLYR
ncbi:hypothetical protein [Flavobacterium crassostreae]|uniref:Uncharacterized protein n=1 Tax=Flavobacterium crassostreae TaxID=1763534 RepID=A0A1B9E5X2_9FLAO|nr:hypothetical protein [Flavobacterium crassostreae]OCB77337.1 hypothetical protein LPBF_04925 [Flavobacterium crassostreae]